jgi:hypothetical protein
VAAYTTAGLDEELRQAEIITRLFQFTYDPVAEEAIESLHSYAVILSQDCDLLWDFQAKVAGAHRDLNGVLIYEAEPVQEVRAKLSGGDILRRIRRHSEERYHLLPPVPADLDILGEGIAELIIDFRRFYTLPADEIYRQCSIQAPEGAKRRCRLDLPYREHLQLRAAFYFQRVALPNPE